MGVCCREGGVVQRRQELYFFRLSLGFFQGEAQLSHSVLGGPQAASPMHLALQCHTVCHKCKDPAGALHLLLAHCSKLTTCVLFLSYTCFCQAHTYRC